MSKKISLRKYQKPIKDAALLVLANNSKAQIRMACGTGKTIVSYFIRQGLSPKKTIVFAPSINLVVQLYQDWLKVAKSNGHQLNSLMVCSDNTASLQYDESVLSMDDVEKIVSVKTTTSVSDVVDFLLSDDDSVIFSTYHSSLVISQAVLETNTIIDFVVCDEAHRCAIDFDRSFSTVLNDNLIPSHKKLFLTATPKIYQTDIDDSNLPSMDNPDVFGQVAYDLPFSKAVEIGVLVDYQVVITQITSDEVKKYLQENNLFETDNGLLETRNIAAQLAVLKSIKKFNLKKGITFHSTIKKSRDFSLGLMSLSQKLNMDIRADYVSGEMPMSKRSNKMAIFESSNVPSVMSNARCLSEGVDVPVLDFIAFIDPKKSSIDITQAIGRVMRLAENKRIGTIIIPLLIDGDSSDFYQTSEFKKIWQIINTLKSLDKSIVSSYKASSRKDSRLQETSKTSVSTKFVFDFDAGFEEMVNSIESILVKKSNQEEWLYRFQELKSYFHVHGKLPSVSDSDKDVKSLSQWCTRQRQLYSEQNLPLDRYTLLNDLYFWWWEHDKKTEDDFSTKVAALKKFVDINSRVPTQKETIDDINVGFFASRMRVFKNDGKLTPDKIETLESIQGWWWHDQDSKPTFEAVCAEIEAFIQKNKRKPSKKIGKSEREAYLARWVESQRAIFSGKRSGFVSKEQMSTLESVWSI